MPVCGREDIIGISGFYYAVPHPLPHQRSEGPGGWLNYCDVRSVVISNGHSDHPCAARSATGDLSTGLVQSATPFMGTTTEISDEFLGRAYVRCSPGGR